MLWLNSLKILFDSVSAAIGPRLPEVARWLTTLNWTKISEGVVATLIAAIVLHGCGGL